MYNWVSLNMARKKRPQRGNEDHDFQVRSYIREQCKERDGNIEGSYRMSLRRRRNDQVMDNTHLSFGQYCGTWILTFLAKDKKTLL